MADVLEIDAQTGKTVERDFTADELAQRAKDKAKQATETKADTAKAKAKAALLDKLGITADEAALLLG
jgi:hypothetical protein